MNTSEVFFYIYVTLLWNYKVIDATRCGGINGILSCCFGYHWDEIQKNCIPCEPGYTGFNCTTKCIYPQYGLHCQSACNCTKEDCNHMTGCKNITAVNVCNRNGTRCCNGYMWNKEMTKCIPCDKGHHGENCDVKCPYPTYGQDCQSVCNCTETTCDHVDGCREHSTRSETNMPHISTAAVNGYFSQKVSANGNQSALMTGIGVLAAVALFIVLAIFYTYQMDHVNKEIDYNIYYTIK